MVFLGGLKRVSPEVSPTFAAFSITTRPLLAFLFDSKSPLYLFFNTSRLVYFVTTLIRMWPVPVSEGLTRFVSGVSLRRGPSSKKIYFVATVVTMSTAWSGERPNDVSRPALAKIKKHLRS